MRDFIRESQNVPIPVYYIGLTGGMFGGFRAENALSNSSLRSKDETQISHLEQQKNFALHLAHAPSAVGNTAVQHFLSQQESDAAKQISSIRSHEPHSTNTGEDLAALGGGALIGAVALALLVTGAKRLYRTGSLRYAGAN